MLIPVGNMNDKRGINANPGAAKSTDWYPGTRPPPGEEEIRGTGEGGMLGDSFVKGISIQTAKYQENNFRKRFSV